MYDISQIHTQREMKGKHGLLKKNKKQCEAKQRLKILQ